MLYGGIQKKWKRKHLVQPLHLFRQKDREEAAKGVLLYVYKHAACGFSAKLTPDQVELISTFSISFPGISAVDYFVNNVATNTPGGIRFDKEIGISFTKKVMGKSNDFIWHTVFQQNNPSDQKSLDSVNIYIVEFQEAAGTSWGNNNINVSSDFIQECKGDLKWEFTSLFYHEMTHMFQWDGEGHTPSMLIEGIADFTVLKAGYAQKGFAKPGQGDSWDQGYDFTARFLEYCDEVVPGFVAKLNKMMRSNFDVKYFEDLTGKPVDQLWMEYKAKYGQ